MGVTLIVLVGPMLILHKRMHTSIVSSILLWMEWTDTPPPMDREQALQQRSTMLMVVRKGSIHQQCIKCHTYLLLSAMLFFFRSSHKILPSPIELSIKSQEKCTIN